ncbi:helix-turn-helix transcriptional regulator [Brevibacterium limosum]|uniref:helix-turn-helix transcriptional regulator n=1 Tax=Brevibacterium limosum TaxID=2697565 RepID=UPI001AA1348A|nr:helix-turn-helix domain-containing protein [Brevibacterium limosum]
MPENAQAGSRPATLIVDHEDQSATLIAEIENYLSQQVQPRTAVMNEHEAAEYIGCSVSWLRNNRRSSTAPPFVKIGKNVRYRIDSLDAWLSQQEIKN